MFDKLPHIIFLASLLWISADSRTLPSVAPEPSGMRIVCYYSSWAMYRPGHGMFDIEDFPVHLCTHAIYAFLGLNNRTWELLVLDPENDVIKGGYRRFTALKKKNPALKTLVSIGGWMEGGRKYSEMASKPERRQTFVNSVVDFLKRFNFDGLDLDWEFPASPDREGAQEDRDNFVILLKELKSAFKKEDWGWMLTAVVPIMQFRIDNGYKVDEITRILDFINLLSYDLRGNWTGFTDVHTPLRRREFDTGEYTGVNIHDGANLWVERGASKDKLSISLALYGRTYTLEDPSYNGLHAPLNQLKTAGDMGSFTRSNGTLAYYEICEALKSGKWDMRYDEVGQSSYAVNGDQWIGYDDKRSLAEKTKYAKEEGYGGVAIWSVDLDDFRGLCGERFALMKVVFKQVTGRAASRIEDPIHPQSISRAPSNLIQSPLSAVHQIPQELSTSSQPAHKLWENENSNVEARSPITMTESVSNETLSYTIQEIANSETSKQDLPIRQTESSSFAADNKPEFFAFDESVGTETTHVKQKFETTLPSTPSWITENLFQLHSETFPDNAQTDWQSHQITPSENWPSFQNNFTDNSASQAEILQNDQSQTSQSTEANDFINTQVAFEESPADWHHASENGSWVRNQNLQSQSHQEGFTEQQITASQSGNNSLTRFQHFTNQQQFTETADNRTPIGFGEQQQFSFNRQSIPLSNTQSFTLPVQPTDPISNDQFELPSQNAFHDLGSSVLPDRDFARVKISNTTPNLQTSQQSQQGHGREGRRDQFQQQPFLLNTIAPSSRPPASGISTRQNFETQTSAPANGQLKIPELQGGFVPSENSPIFAKKKFNISVLNIQDTSPALRETRFQVPLSTIESEPMLIEGELQTISPGSSLNTFPLPFSQGEIQSETPASDFGFPIDLTEANNAHAEELPVSFNLNAGAEQVDSEIQTLPPRDIDESPPEISEHMQTTERSSQNDEFSDSNFQSDDLRHQQFEENMNTATIAGDPIQNDGASEVLTPTFIPPTVPEENTESIIYPEHNTQKWNFDDFQNKNETESLGSTDATYDSQKFRRLQPEIDVTQQHQNTAIVDLPNFLSTPTFPSTASEYNIGNLVSEINTDFESNTSSSENTITENSPSVTPNVEIRRPIMPSTFKPPSGYFQLDLGFVTPDNVQVPHLSSSTENPIRIPFTENSQILYSETPTKLQHETSTLKTRRRRLRKRLKMRPTTSESPLPLDSQQPDLLINHPATSEASFIIEEITSTNGVSIMSTTDSAPETTQIAPKIKISSSLEIPGVSTTQLPSQITTSTKRKRNRRKRIRFRAQNQTTTLETTTKSIESETSINVSANTSAHTIDNVDSHFESLAPKRRVKVARLRPASTENREVYAVSPPNDNDPRPIVSATAPECTKGQLYTSHPNCDKYWWCIHGAPTLNTCGQGLLWNPQTSSCDWPANINRDDCE